MVRFTSSYYLLHDLLSLSFVHVSQPGRPRERVQPAVKVCVDQSHSGIEGDVLNLEALILEYLVYTVSATAPVNKADAIYLPVLLISRKVPGIKGCRVFPGFRQYLVKMTSDTDTVHVASELAHETRRSPLIRDWLLQCSLDALYDTCGIPLAPMQSSAREDGIESMFCLER